MKNIKYFTVLLSVLLMGCSSDDDNENTNQNGLNIQITTIEPRKVYTGDVVTISGSGLDLDGLVFKVDQVVLPILELSSTEAKLFVPEQANTGIINASVGTTDNQYGDFVVYQEQDNFYAHMQDSDCQSSKIAKLRVDTFEPSSGISNLPSTCISVDKVLFCKAKNILIYSYTYLLPDGNEARKAIIKNLNTQALNVLVLSEGPNDVDTSTLLSVSRDKLYFVEYRSQNPPGLKNRIIFEYFLEFNQSNLTYSQFRTDGEVSIASAFNDAERTLLVYYREEGNDFGMFKRTEQSGANYNYTVQENLKDIFVNNDGQAFALEYVGDNVWNVTRIRADAGTFIATLSTFTADSAENLFYSESTNRLFVRYTLGGVQKLHKVPLNVGESSDSDINPNIQSIYSYD